jgi:hypothetical protein
LFQTIWNGSTSKRSRTILGYIEDKGYEALEKLYEDEEEIRYRIDDVGYEPVE